MLEALKSLEIDNACHFIGSAHPLYGRLEEFNGYVSCHLLPDKISREILDPLPVLLRVSIRVLFGFVP